MLVPSAGREGLAHSEGRGASELEASRESTVLLLGKERVGHTGSGLWAVSSSRPHPRLLRSRVEPHRFFLSSGAGIRGFPVSSVPLQGSTSPVASSSDGEGWVCEQERVPWVRSVCPATTGPMGLPEPPPGSSLLAGNLLFPSRQQVIEGDTGDAGPDGLNPLIALLGIGG